MPDSVAIEEDAAAVAGGTPEIESPHWRRNASTLFYTQFWSQLCLTLSFPLLPLFIYSELGVRTASRLAFWNGVAAAVFGVAYGLAGPVWGIVADRYGRKKMTLRAFAGGGLSLGAVAITFTPLQFVLARFACGLLAGTVPAVNAYIASETPRVESTRVLARVNAGAAVGSSLGPMVGGVLASVLNLRLVFVGSGLTLAVCSLPVLLWTRELSRPRSGPLFKLASVRELAPGRGRSLLALIVAFGLTSFCFLASQQLLVVRLLEVDHRRAALLAGGAFAAGALLTAAGSASAPRAVGRAGYRTAAALAASLLALSAALQATGDEALLLAGMGSLGLAYGVLQPTLYAMLGLEASVRLKATVFGLATGASAIGISAGPLLTGIAAAGLGVWAGQLLAATAGLITAALLVGAVREPVLDTLR